MTIVPFAASVDQDQAAKDMQSGPLPLDNYPLDSYPLDNYPPDDCPPHNYPPGNYPLRRIAPPPGQLPHPTTAPRTTPPLDNCPHQDVHTTICI